MTIVPLYPFIDSTTDSHPPGDFVRPADAPTLDERIAALRAEFECEQVATMQSLELRDSITIDYHGRCVKIYAEVGDTIDRLVDDLIRPALLALGFHHKTVDDVLGEDG